MVLYLVCLYDISSLNMNWRLRLPELYLAYIFSLDFKKLLAVNCECNVYHSKILGLLQFSDWWRHQTPEWRHSISLRLMFKNASIAMMKTDKTCGKVNHSSSAKKKKHRMPFVLLNLPSTYIIQSIHINKAFRWLIFLFESIAWEHLAKINVTKTILAYLYTVIHTIKNHAILNLEIIKKIIELKHVLCVNGRILDPFPNV